MTRAIEWIISLLIVIALFVVIGLFLPSKRVVSHSVETNRPMSTVNDILGGFARFRDWNSLINQDPTMQITTSGPEIGVGARLEFSSADRLVGSGSWEVVDMVPGETITHALDVPGRGHNKTMTFRFERTGQRNQNVKITQRYSVEYGWDLIGRYAGLYVTRAIRDDMKRGLEKLGNLLTTIPRFDYSQHEPGFEFRDLPAINALSVTTAAKRANDDIALAMVNQLKWIEQVMEKSGLEAAGPMRIVTNEFSTDTYGFDVVMPIRPKSSEPAAKADAGADAAGDAAVEAAAEAAAATDPAAPLELLDVKLDGPVQYVQIPAMRAAVTTYIGPSPGLPRIRDLVRAWAMVRGANTTDRPFEEYLNPIKDMLSEEAEFRVFWPVQVPGVDSPEPVLIAPLPTDEADAGPAPAAATEPAAPAAN
jgi:hypothetical protein